MPDINSVSPDFRDFLLNRNLITDTVTDNGLSGLLVGVGTPILNIGTLADNVLASPDILDDGVFYKDLNLITNKFQGTDDDYRLASINYTTSITPPASAFIYSANYTDDEGVLSDTLNTPANGPFQGGDIRQFNTSKNLYDDPSMRLLVNMDDVLLPNVKYTNYIDLNSSIVNPAIDVLGSIFNGQGVGIGPTGGGVVPTFDLRSSLVGRVLGGTGVIADTPIGQAGAKYLTIALANNAAFGLQQETLGNINLNPLSLLKGNPLLVPNYDITVPKGKLGKTLDFGAKVLGFESPFSLYERSASIFNKENPISNIDRANSQLANTGKGQVLALFANVRENKFKPAYQDDRVKGGDTASDAEKGQNGSAINPNLYAFSTTDGKVIDFLNNDGSDGSNSPISQSNYNLEGLVRTSGFESLNNRKVSYSNPFNGEGKEPDNGTSEFIWSDDSRNYLGARELDVFDGTEFKNPNDILTKTQNLFNSGKMRTLTTGKSVQQNRSQINSAVAGEQGSEYMSRGSGVLKHLSQTEIETDVDNMFCRTWTTFDKYDQVQDLQKSSGIDEKTAYRRTQSIADSVLGDNGFVRIAPTVGEDAIDAAGESGIKNYMFSIENLAWADTHADLLPCELGPGDLMTGKRGRIMWFPPYDLSVTENTSVDWASTNFIGRGEPVYTYNNTERTGTLQFKIVVDHPSYLNALKGETDDYIASFFAGCTDIDPLLAEKLTTTEKDALEGGNAPADQKKEIAVDPVSVPKVSFYFPNDKTSIPVGYEEEFGTSGLGQIMSDGIVGSKRNYVDSNDFGLNGDKNPGKLEETGGWISLSSQILLKKVLNEDCQACKIKISGYASISGDKSGKNQELSQDRANAIKEWFIAIILDSTQDIYGSDGITIDDRFEFVTGKGTIDSTPCPQTDEDTSSDIGCKSNRKVDVNIVFDSDLKSVITKEDTDTKENTTEQRRVSSKIINRFYNECNYFEKLQQKDKTVFSSIREKLKFFHPAFHAITPEGLNSRLTFLQQCTRQGPTMVAGAPDNLAFGRPPICILRLGDFYHCKIAIDNIGLSYEPLVWDLNPEGIGVQPMLATVDLSFKMIGGQSMKGPINKLQNAVSFNFFGNTEVYDDRSDRIAKTGVKPTTVSEVDPVTGEGIAGNIIAGGNYVIVPGEGPNTPWKELINEANKNALSDNVDPINQEVLAEKEATSTQVDPTPSVNCPLDTFINNITVTKVVLNEDDKTITTYFKRGDLDFDICDDIKITTNFYLVNVKTNEKDHIGFYQFTKYDTNIIGVNVDTDITTVDTSVIQFDVNLESNVSKRRLRLANESPDDYIISHTTNSHKGLGKVKSYNNKKDIKINITF